MARGISILRCISGALLLALAGCTGIGVNLGTEKPLAVDINMKLDVYQHPDTTVQKKVAAAATSTDLPVDVRMRRKNRLGEINVLKNSRTIGETHLGLLEIRTLPPGDYGDYVTRTVDAENKDRMVIMEDISKKDNLPLEKVQAEQARLAANRSFNGEWIELAQPDGTFKWVQKGHETDTPAKPTPSPAKPAPTPVTPSAQ